MNQEPRTKNQEQSSNQEQFSNPFSTRHVRPGAIAYQFPSGAGAHQLVDRLAAQDWRGEIVGPHGSGKSTLLAALLPALEQAGRKPWLITLHDGERKLPVDLARQPDLAADTLVIIDGYEQLSRWRRHRLSALCRRRGWGLLVTSHVPVGFPLLYETHATLNTAVDLVAQLLGSEAALISRQEIADRFAAHAGNVREVLFDLYDLYEQRRATGNL